MKTRLFILGLSLLLFACSQKAIDEYSIHGIDVSRWQEEVDWKKVEMAGAQFAFVKATEGDDHLDKYFNDNWLALDNRNIAKGAYLFYRPQSYGKMQAEFFIKNVKLGPGDLPPVIDFETTEGRSDSVIITGLINCANKLEEHYKVKPIIYTNIKLYHRYIMGNFDNYPLWIAWYEENPPILLKFKKWDFWQYSMKGKIDGVKGDVDKNVFQGDSLAFEKIRIP